MIKVYQGCRPADAHRVCGLLHAEGIPAEVPPAVLPGARPAVWILEPAHLGRAMDVVTRWRRNGAPPPPGPEWTCPGCGEALGGPFGECWRCGAARP